MNAARRKLPEFAQILFESSGKVAESQSGNTAESQSAPVAVLPSSTDAAPQSGEPADLQISKSAKPHTGKTAKRPSGKSAASRMGTLREPYRRRDGVKVVHVSYSLPESLARDLRVFTARLDSGERGNFIAACLREGMKRGWPWE